MQQMEYFESTVHSGLLFFQRFSRDGACLAVTMVRSGGLGQMDDRCFKVSMTAACFSEKLIRD